MTGFKAAARSVIDPTARMCFLRADGHFYYSPEGALEFRSAQAAEDAAEFALGALSYSEALGLRARAA